MAVSQKNQLCVIWPNGRGKAGAMLPPGGYSIDFKYMFIKKGEPSLRIKSIRYFDIELK